MNLNDLYEMRDPRDAYERDVDNSQAGMGKQSRSDVTGEEEPSGVFTVVINGKPWKTGSSNEMFALASRVADKHSDKKVAVKWPTGELNTVKSRDVTEGYHNSKTIITEALITQKLWENAGRKLMEAQLTADQITQIFQQVEQGATAAGSNRTMLGKGKDAASAVNQAWEDLKTKVQNSGPIKGVDAMYDKAAEQLKQATGGDQGVMKYVQKYRDFAKAHPVAQSLIYSALIAAAGISGAGLGGAAALGLFKLVDKLLQGEKFSSAAYQGAKTGAMAYGASKLADYVKGKPEGSAGSGGSGSGEAPPDIQQGLAADQAFQDSMLKKFPTTDGYTYSSSGDSLQVFDSTGRKVFTGDIPLKTMDMKQFADLTNNGQMATPGISSGSISSDPMAGISNAGSSVTNTASGTLSGVTGEQMASHPAYQAMIQKFGNTPGARQAAMAAAKAAILKGQVNESINLSESQIFLLIGKIVERQHKIDEGIMDTIKGAAGKAVDWAKTKGTNLTTKVTADKLLQAWKKAGSPTDSEAVAKIIQSAGIPSDSIKQVYGTMKIPFAGGAGAAAPVPAANPTAQKPAAGGIPAVPVKPAATAQTPAATPAANPATPQATSTTAGAPSKVTYGGLLAPKKPAAPVADFSKTGFSGYQTATAKQPAKQPVVAPAKQPSMAEGHTEVKDKEGKVVSWKDDSEWHPVEKNKQGQPKDPRGVVTHLSDVARRKTADQQGMAEGDVDSDGYSVDHADSGEYDYEGDQARDQMNTIVRAARRLDGLLDDNENMPEWVQMKVTLAADYLDTAADYIESNQEPELDEGERGRGRPPSNTQDTTPVTPGRVEKTATGIRHHADASRYGGTEPDNDEDNHLMSKSHISRLGKMTEPDIDEGEKVGNMDADKFDAAMARLKQLAGAGPMKTVYDPTKRVYRNVPAAVQPKK